MSQLMQKTTTYINTYQHNGTKFVLTIYIYMYILSFSTTKILSL